MSIEVERKFLVKGDGWKSAADEGVACRQGYLVSDEKKSVRVRILGSRSFLTVKGAPDGISRVEFEYEIDLADAEYMMMLCTHVLKKVRYHLNYCGLIWEVDVFSEANEGLVMAEVELEAEDQTVELPAWAGEEVSEDPRYYNACLARRPFTSW
jgi:adenylate cyclase